MSILIGYWSNVTGNRSPGDLQQLLNRAVAGLRSSESRISFFDEPCSQRTGGESGAGPPHSKVGSTSFGIAIHGRHTTLHSANAGEGSGQSLTATLAAAGTGFEPNVWASVSSDGLLLGRDVFGRATIFWTQTETAVWFSSRLEFLLRVVKRAPVSLDGFYLYGCFSFVPAPHTPVENIFAVPVGVEMIWKAPEATPKSHVSYQWRETAEQNTDETTSARCLRRLLEESVAGQLASSSREPIGVFLSGGLDSSVTAALLVRAGARVRAYTLDLSADCFSEVAYAELVARRLGIPLTKIPVAANSMRRALASTATRLDGLYGDGVTVPLAIMYQHASKEVETVFNGEGGDQMFGGWTNKPLIAASVYENTASYQDEPEASFAARYMRTFHRFYGHEVGVYTDAVRREIDSGDCQAALANALDPSYTRSLLHRLRRANLLLKGADNIQPRTTNLGLSYNLDVRTLFCSRPLAEWTFGVSGDLWLRAGCEKYLLKRAVEDLLPSEVVWREKRGMGVPLTLWLGGPLRHWWQRQLHRRVVASEGLWQADLAQRVSNGELSGQVQGRRIGETLWLMLMWRAWREHVFRSDSRPVEGHSFTSWRFSLPFTTALKRT